MAGDANTSLAVESLSESNSVKVSKDLNDNAAANAIFVKLTDETNQNIIDANGRLLVKTPLIVDDAAFTVGTQELAPSGFIYQATPDSVDDGDAGAARMTADRRILVAISDISLEAQTYPIKVSKNTSPNAETNPLFVQVVQGVSGTEVIDEDAQDVAGQNGSADHDYTVTAGKTLILKKVEVAASIAAKWVVKYGPVASLATYVTKFTSMACPSLSINVDGFVEVAAGNIVRVTKVNREADATSRSMYSTIAGNEI